VEAEMFLAEGWSEGRTDMTNLVFAYWQFWERV